MGAKTASEGAASESRVGMSEYNAVGVVCGFIGLLFFPASFITLLAGVQLFRQHSRESGVKMLAWGAVSFLIGVVVGVIALAVLSQY